MKNKVCKYLMLFLFCSVVLFFDSCKKGENDPFLSLRSRDNRISGVWELKKEEYNDKTIESFGDSVYRGGVYVDTVYVQTNTIKDVFDGSLMNYSGKEWVGFVFKDTTYSLSYYFRMTINKDGSYETYEFKGGVEKYKIGNWWWLNGDKKKTRIALDDDYNSYDVDQLKNKELILTNEYSTFDRVSSVEYKEQEVSLKMTFEKVIIEED